MRRGMRLCVVGGAGLAIWRGLLLFARRVFERGTLGEGWTGLGSSARGLLAGQRGRAGKGGGTCREDFCFCGESRVIGRYLGRVLHLPLNLLEHGILES